jgi:hypothetical protein
MIAAVKALMKKEFKKESIAQRKTNPWANI